MKNDDISFQMALVGPRGSKSSFRFTLEDGLAQAMKTKAGKERVLRAIAIEIQSTQHGVPVEIVQGREKKRVS